MIRGGSQERRKIVAGVSGSGELDSVADVLLSYSTVLYPDPTTTITTTTVDATTTGEFSVLISCVLTKYTLPNAGYCKLYNCNSIVSPNIAVLPATEMTTQATSKPQGKTTRGKRKRKKEKEREHTKDESKEKGSRKTYFTTQPATGILYSQ